MAEDIARAVADTVEQIRQIYIKSGIASWNAATNGVEENLEAAARARAEEMQFWADAVAFARFRALDQANAANSDPLLARQIHLLHNGFAANQRDAATIEQMTTLMKQIDDVYMNFRGEVGGKKLPDNGLRKILEDETDNEVRREAWEASKQIGPLVAPSIRQLAHLRNQTAHSLGYSNYHRMALELDEIDPDWLYSTFDDLAERTTEPFRQVKAELDAQLSQRFRVPVDELRPWHYSDLYFQEAPNLGSLDVDVFFKDQSLEALATRTYDGLGMDTRDILARSDLYERDQKNQHAFCTNIDREGDIRTLCNLRPNRYWADTILHELGHGVYEKYISPDVPWLLRTYAHLISTECMAILMGGMCINPDWLTTVRGLSAGEVDRVATPIRKYQRLKTLIFARWAMVMVSFERAMYEDPDRDLDSLWWDLVEKYQLLHRPDDRAMPDWATKYHVALAPAYYQNYLIGEIMSVQWEHWLKQHAGGIVDHPAAGEFFRNQVFGLGATLPWNDGLEHATGEKLNISYYVDKYVSA